MKKKWFVLFLLVFCVNYIFSQNSSNLDESIKNAANYLHNRIPAGTSVAVFNFSSDSQRLSEYIVDELTIALATVGMNVYDRKNLDEVNREIYHGFTGAVNEDTAQFYGRDKGVPVVIIGSLIKSSDTVFRLRVQAIVVETKQIQAAETFNVRADNQLLSFLNITLQNEQRFSNVEKTKAGFKNMFFGLGSFQMGDPLGGSVSLTLELISLVSLFVGIQPLLSDDGSSVFWNDINEYEYNNYYEYVYARDEQDRKLRELHTTLAIAGVGGLVLSWTWGFIRPHMYDKPVAVQKIARVIDSLNIGLVPMNRSAAKVSVSLNYSF